MAGPAFDQGTSHLRQNLLPSNKYGRRLGQRWRWRNTTNIDMQQALVAYFGDLDQLWIWCPLKGCHSRTIKFVATSIQK